ncbi:cupin domain-containing protein [Acuticoccus sediminis]|uniref:cupin domain-containing protein n=1 Tax=Acuticoccus sediminis TaxID=2184697 RepID=UPI001CFCA60C|nr:cupin domain-containing protein [Acuticoccus sediminis]
MTSATIFAALRADMRTITGPLVDLSHTAGADGYVVIRSIAPVGVVVPLHSHGERETMVIVEGVLTAWLDGAWRRFGPGEIIEVAPDVPHALRNDGPCEVALVLVTTPRMARFFAQIATGQADAAMTPERLAHLAATAAAFGFRNAPPAEQAAIGIAPPADGAG